MNFRNIGLDKLNIYFKVNLRTSQVFNIHCE